MRPFKNIIVQIFKSSQIALVIFCVCCSTKDRKILRHTPNQLNSAKILGLLDDIAVQSYDNSNFHVFYREYLNDSSWVLYIVQNDFLGNDSLGICEVLNMKNHHVFIYGDTCNVQLDKNLTSKNGGPFQFDGISFLLLVEERNNSLEYFRLTRRFKFENSLIEPLDSTVLDLN